MTDRMESLTNLFGLFGAGIGVGVILSCFFAFVGLFIAMFKRIFTAS